MKYPTGKNIKGKGGRKPKPDAEKASFKIGGFWLTKAEKEAYDKKFKASGLDNQTEFFRRIIFGGALKLYYRDIHTEKIYTELLKIEREIQGIGINYNQVVKRIHSVSADANKFSSLKLLQELTLRLEYNFKQILLLFEAFSHRSAVLPESPENGEDSE